MKRPDRWRLLAAAATLGCTPAGRTGSAGAPAATAHGQVAAPSAGWRQRLATTIDSLADAPEFANAHFGILIVDPSRRDTLYERNAGKLFMPASNMKIVTAAVGLERLGPEYRYRTTFAARGTVSGGVLRGDLVVIGRGDPSVSDHMMGDAMVPLRAIADSLRAKGIERITGRVVAGGNAFPGPTFGFGWSYDDFEDSFSAPVDELFFNEGFSVVRVWGGARAGDPPRVETRPARSWPRVRVLATTAARTAEAPFGLRAWKDSTSWDVVLDGRIAPGDSAAIEVPHHDPDQAYVAAVAEALRDRGIVAAGNTEADGAARLDTLATLTSPPLRDILKAMMKPSQNQIAEILFRTLALETTGVGSPDSARVVVQNGLAAWGVAPDAAVVRDGSGLSRYDYVTPRTLLRVLDAMRTSPNFSVFYESLPIAGVDGTLANRLKGTVAQGNVHAKTGTMSQARSLSGYVTTADGRMLEFSMLCNNWTVPVRTVDRAQDAIVTRLAGLRIP